MGDVAPGVGKYPWGGGCSPGGGGCSCVVLQALVEVGSPGVWFSEEQCLSVTEKLRSLVFVFQDFDGDAFHHIAATGNRYVLCRASCVVRHVSCVVCCVSCVVCVPRSIHV